MMIRIFLFTVFLSFAFTAFCEDITSLFEKRRKFDYFYLEAIRLKEQGEHTDAFQALQHALTIDSTSAAALYELAQYYLFLNQDSLAMNALQRAVGYYPRFEYQLSLAEIYADSHKYAEAIALYESLAQSNPDKTDISIQLSNLYLRVGNIDKAIFSLNNLENNLGVNESFSLQKFSLYKHVGKNAEAIAEVEKLAAKFPMETKYPIIMGDCFLEQGDTVQALACYNRVRNLEPDNPHYFISMAHYYEYQGDEDAVVREIDKALRNPALDVDTKLNILGKYIQNLHRTKKDVEGANALLETLLEQHPQEKALNMLYGEFLLSQNKMDEAKFQFQLVTERQPDNIAAWQHLLDIAMKTNDMVTAIVICDRVLQIFPEAPEFFLYKSIAYGQMQAYAKSLSVLREGLPYLQDNDRPALLSSYYAQTGDMLYQTGHHDEAYDAYEKAIEKDNANLLVMNNYAYFLALDKKDLDKAERMSAKCVQAQPNNVTYMDTYAWVFFQKGNYSLAKFYIENALSKVNTYSGEILEHYGDILFKTGDVDRAVNEWEKALKIKEESDESTDLLKKKIKDRMYYEE